jgi:hypothetical protein
MLHIIDGLEDGLKEKRPKPKKPVDKKQRLRQVLTISFFKCLYKKNKIVLQVMKQLKTSFVNPKRSRSGNVDYSQPDEVIRRIKEHQMDVFTQIRDLSKSIDKDHSDILKRGIHCRSAFRENFITLIINSLTTLTKF